jgi:hypothetical protein
LASALLEHLTPRLTSGREANLEFPVAELVRKTQLISEKEIPIIWREVRPTVKKSAKKKVLPGLL